jgi:hypothetical protein
VVIASAFRAQDSGSNPAQSVCKAVGNS